MPTGVGASRKIRPAGIPVLRFEQDSSFLLAL
jgi:hypothetical protein